jgi:hypothetical protein
MACIFMFEGEIMHRLLNDKNENNIITISATIFTLAIIAIALSMITTPVAATIGDTTATKSSSMNTTIPSSSSAIELSLDPIQQEMIRTTSQTPINQTHMSITYSGNGTLTLPNTLETINITTNGTGIVSLMDQSVYGKETIRTEDGQTATATFYEIVKLDPTTGAGKGITLGVMHTDSSGSLAVLNSTILVGTDDIQPNGQEVITIWEWKSGISSNTGFAPPT